MPAAYKPALRKVCGVTRPADAEHAILAGANAVGMVFFAQSPRSVSRAAAAQIAGAVPPAVRRVGVFVNAGPEEVAATVREAGLNVAQLHGDESPAECAAVSRALGVGVALWKALRVAADFDAAELEKYAVDAFVLDAAREGAYGGTGETIPWQVAAEAKRYGRIVLAGGLHGGNAAEAVRVARPWGVDASSRLEQRPGVKDPDKVALYLDAVR